MNSIKILATSSYLPNTKISNDYFLKKYNLPQNWIEKRTGIKTRYYAEDETISSMAEKVAKKLVNENKINTEEIDLILVATTSSDKLMPGISFDVQKSLQIKKCICMDILAGCSGYINAFDIARKYIACDNVRKALIIGVEKISNYLDFEDKNTAVILGDGAGAILIGISEKEKYYSSNIESIAENNEILSCHNNQKLLMDGKNVFKFAIMKTTKNVKETLEKANLETEDIKYFLFHQSNARIIEEICKKLEISNEKAYMNIEEVGNTFCASIPIILDEIIKKNLIASGDKILLCGYGGGLNLGSIVIEN